MGTNPAELMNRRTTADDGKIGNMAMAGQHHIVGKNNIIAHNAVMGDMGIGQEGTTVPYFGDHTAALGARIHGYTFADQAIRADLKRRWFTMEFKILRLMANGGERENLAASTNGRASGNGNMAQ
jgi:hypothetical protein